MKKLSVTLAVLLVSLVVAAGLFAFLFDPKDYIDDIQTEFAATTGYELVIDGQPRVSLFPRPVLELTRISLPGGLGAEGPALAEMDLVRFYPRITTLFVGRFELALVQVQGLRLQLLRDGQGRASWDIGDVQPPQTRAGRTDALPPFPEPTKPPGAFDLLAAETDQEPQELVIDRIEFADARVTWDDRGSERRLELDDLEVFAGPLAPHAPLPVRMTGTLVDGDGGSLAGVQAEGTLIFGERLQLQRLERLLLALEEVDFGDGLAANLLLHTAVDVDPEAQRYLAEQVSLEIQAWGAALADGRIEADAGARVELDLNAERLTASGLSIRSGTLSARGAALGQALLSAPVLSGNLVVDKLDLRAWLTQRDLPLPQTTDPGTLQLFSLDTRWRITKGRLGLQDLALGIDETRFAGGIERLATSPPGYRFELTADRLDLDRYLPPALHAKVGNTSQRDAPAAGPVTSQAGQVEQRAAASSLYVKTSAAAPPASTPGRFPVKAQTLGDLDLEGRLRVDELKLLGLGLGQVDLKIRAKDGRLEIDDQVQRFYEGVLAGKLSLDARGTEPRFALVQRAEGVQVGPLLADLAWGDSLGGRGEFSANLNATGWSPEVLRRSLAGTLAVRIDEGTIKGVNLERLIREAEARLRGKQPPKDLPTHTDFNDLRASGEVQEGIVRNRDLLMTLDHLRVSGAGTVDLVREQFDYRFEPMFVKPPKGRGIKELEGIPIPVHLTGTFSHPRWGVDVGSALRAAAERRLGEQGRDLLDELEERTGIKGLEKGLKGLFGR